MKEYFLLRYAGRDPICSHVMPCLLARVSPTSRSSPRVHQLHPFTDTKAAVADAIDGPSTRVICFVRGDSELPHDSSL